MAEDGHSAVVKDDKVTIQPSSSATSQLPWTAEEQKVFLHFDMHASTPSEFF